jgi:hypothetical protein
MFSKNKKRNKKKRSTDADPRKKTTTMAVSTLVNDVYIKTMIKEL